MRIPLELEYRDLDPGFRADSGFVPRTQAYFEMQPGGAIRLSLFGDIGETIDVNNNQRADQLILNPVLELKLGRHFNASLDHRLQRLDVEGVRLLDAHLSQLRLVYNLSVRTFVRGIFQLTDIRRDPDLFATEVEPKVESLFTQLLFSYKLNPQTVLFLGRSDNLLGLEDVDLARSGRTFFVKLGYTFIL